MKILFFLIFLAGSLLGNTQAERQLNMIEYITSS